ncbi:trifunctional serine/threonine-protein kinase/ATP-binding protein/SpoIIE family protein phosphatase [Leptospira alstonii]|uniref:Stage II sporulation protein E n=2 Tax=Leptospira alstonii TaxID=28452 RepID=M6CLJ2_9LEPT|nr:trifunctional serine/threonine-protein kinase/ATP-binding protein/SpoIIE family protein phosphatase [Leptospira alstonii]EMJ92807.1 stage II sporulation protein E [Leptospira alstonii serovar Sichuan str. 79601]EQA78958.1 SpoIIE-like protein phosphatase domain protein [Leptospira alstonii serovar Pingchang str. 80-412]
MSIRTNSSPTSFHTKETLLEDHVSTVYRGILRGESKTKILRIQKEKTKEEDSFYFLNEYEIGKLVSDDHILKPERILRIQDKYCLVYENLESALLSDHISEAGPLSVEEFLQIALLITENLVRLHSQGILHNQIGPNSFFYNADTKTSVLAWLGSSSLLIGEKGNPAPLQISPTLLAYCSPERTGRLNRLVDFRSDGYSVGALFYLLLTGKPPFESDDPLEIIHSHIARVPIPVFEKRKEIPVPISNLVMKLLSKMPEERYFSLESLLYDLKTLYDFIRSQRSVLEFIPGFTEKKDKFRISEKLYGRDKEKEIIEEAISSVYSGVKAAILIKGKSGTGKTSLIQDAILSKELNTLRSFKGKFEEDKKEIPYFALRQILVELSNHLLTQSEYEIQFFRREIGEKLGDNVRLLAQFIPEIGNLIGISPVLSEHQSQKDDQFLFIVILRFLSVCFNRRNPALLILDDIQWADPASLALIEFISGQTDWEGMLFVFICRNEEEHSDFLNSFRERILNSEILLQEISLNSLDQTMIRSYVTDSLDLKDEDTKKLTEILYQKTNGNPFFLNQFFNTLYTESFIRYQKGPGIWSLDWDRIIKKTVTENVLDLLTEEITRLPGDTQKFLKVAACVGNLFDLGILYRYFQDHPETIENGIRECIKQGIIIYQESQVSLYPILQILKKENTEVPDKNRIFDGITFRFSHDKINQVIWESIAPKEMAEIHKDLARLLIESDRLSPKQERIPEIANHLIKSQKILNSKEEIETFNHYVILAGNSAKLSAAFNNAYNLFTLLKKKITEESWKEKKDQCVQIYKSFAESAYFLSKTFEAENAVQVLLSKLNDRIELADVYLMQLEVMNAKNDLEGAYRIGLKALGSLNVEFPEKPGTWVLILEFLKMIYYQRGRSPEKLREAKKNQDPHKIETINILTNMLNYGKHSDSKLFVFLFLKLMNITLKEGNSPVSFFGYAGFGSLLFVTTGNFKTTLRYWDLGEHIIQIFNADRVRGRYLFGKNMLLDFYRHPFAKLPLLAEDAYEKCVQYGDYLWAAFSLIAHSIYQLYSSDNSESYHEILIKDAKRAERLGYETVYVITASSDFLIRSLGNLSGQNVVYKDKEMSTETFEREVLIPNANGTANTWYAVLRGKETYLRGEWEEGLEIFSKFANDLERSRTIFVYSEYRFYKSLHLIRLGESKGKLNWSDLFFIKRSISLFKTWSETFPDNFKSYYCILKAEYNEYRNDFAKADTFYELALSSLQKNESKLRKAIVHEHSGAWELRRGRKQYANYLLKIAEKQYRTWGASGKANRIQEMRQHEEETGIFLHTREEALLDTILKSAENLDLRSVLKSSQSISEIIEQDELLKKLMRTIMENAGATRGFLILPRKGGLYVETGQDIEEEDILPRSLILDFVPELLPVEIVYYCYRSGQRILLNNTSSKESPHSLNSYVVAKQPKSLLCLPITKQGRILSVLYLENRLTYDVFDEHRLEILEILSSQAAISLENAKLYEDITSLNAELEKKVELRTEELMQSLKIIRKDLLYSKKIQRSILPEHPVLPGIQYSVSYQPMDEVGGDFYDLFEIRPGVYRFFVADATGHGVQAALITMAIKSEYEHLKKSEKSPSSLLKELNVVILEKFKTLYITCVVADINVKNHTMEYSSAGHPPQILLREGQTDLLHKTGAILGLKKDFVYYTEKVKLKSGDRIYLFTDGIYEQFNAAKNEFGETRLLTSIDASSFLSPEDQVSKIQKDLNLFLQGAPIQDDLTLIVVEIF